MYPLFCPSIRKNGFFTSSMYFKKTKNDFCLIKNFTSVNNS